MFEVSPLWEGRRQLFEAFQNKLRTESPDSRPDKAKLNPKHDGETLDPDYTAYFRGSGVGGKCYSSIGMQVHSLGPLAVGSLWLQGFKEPIWEFPKIGDPNMVP